MTKKKNKKQKADNPSDDLRHAREKQTEKANLRQHKTKVEAEDKKSTRMNINESNIQNFP